MPINPALQQFVQANEPRFVSKLSRDARKVYDKQVLTALGGARSPREFAKWMGRAINDFWNMGNGKEEDLRQRYYPGMSGDDLMDVSDALDAAARHYQHLNDEFEDSPMFLRSAALRIASELPKGDPTRRALLDALR